LYGFWWFFSELCYKYWECLYCIVLNARMVDEWWIATDVQGSGHGLIGMLSCHLHWRDWGDPWKAQSWQLLLRPGTSQKQVLKVSLLDKAAGLPEHRKETPETFEWTVRRWRMTRGDLYIRYEMMGGWV
jgi:hypothetical protein